MAASISALDASEGSVQVGVTWNPPKAVRERISRAMTQCLRHKAEEWGLHIGTDGYVEVSEMLTLPKLKDLTEAGVRELVASCPKQRFQLCTKEGKLFIRATQGHSIAAVHDDELLVKIEAPSELPLCYHGTFRKSLDAIMAKGLCKMERNHIHMVTKLPEDEGVVSGMRKSCEIVISIDVEAAMAAGIEFFRSANGVILSPGLADEGIIPACFFKEVIVRK